MVSTKFYYNGRDTQEQLQQQQRQLMFYETYFLKKFIIFARKHLSWRHFLISIVTKRLQHRCFPVNIPKFLRTYFSWNTSGGASTNSLEKRCSEKLHKLKQNFSLPESFFIKLQNHNLQLCQKKRVQYGCFAVNFEKFLRTILCRASLNGCS